MGRDEGIRPNYKRVMDNLSETEKKLVKNYCDRNNFQFIRMELYRAQKYSRKIFVFRCLEERPNHPNEFKVRSYDMMPGPKEKGCPICAWDDRRVPAADILKSMKEMNISAEQAIPLNKSKSLKYRCLNRNHEIEASLQNLEYRFKKHKSACYQCDLEIENEKILDKFIVNPTIKRIGNYTSNTAPIQFVHSLNGQSHSFHLVPKDVKRLKAITCIICAPGTRTKSIEWLQDEVKDRKIEILPDQIWRGVESKYKARCLICGTEWTPTAKDLTGQSKSGCPSCSDLSRSQRLNKFETCVRYILEMLVGCKFMPSPIEISAPVLSKFEKVFHPKAALRVDGLNEEKKIAFEFNGSQHYRITKTYTPQRSDLELQRNRDQMKRLELESQGYTVLEIDGSNARMGNLEKLVRDILARNLIPINSTAQIDIQAFWAKHMAALKKTAHRSQAARIALKKGKV